MIVVLDTNVWVSGFEFGGTPDRAIDKALMRDRLAISDFIQDEIVRVGVRKFGWGQTELTMLDELLAQALFVGITGEVAGVCRDVKDDAVLETAWRANAEILVAGDKDLLSLGSFRETAIITPAEYVRGA